MNKRQKKKALMKRFDRLFPKKKRNMEYFISGRTTPPTGTKPSTMTLEQILEKMEGVRKSRQDKVILMSKFDYAKLENRMGCEVSPLVKEGEAYILNKTPLILPRDIFIKRGAGFPLVD